MLKCDCLETLEKYLKWVKGKKKSINPACAIITASILEHLLCVKF